jgi:hypothetical protein
VRRIGFVVAGPERMAHSVLSQLFQLLKKGD